MIKKVALGLTLTAFSIALTLPAKAADPAPEAKPAVAEKKPETKKEKTDNSKAVKGTKKMANPVVVMETSMGKVEIELDQEKAPISVANFLKYTSEGFYDGTIFHRVISNFMIQGGGFNPDMSQKKTHDPIKNEATNGLHNGLGTVAMARTSVVDSATAQFFINVKDNAFLDHTSADPRGYGYAVFGKVTSGMDVVEKIKATPTTTKDGYTDVPATAVTIKSIKLK